MAANPLDTYHAKRNFGATPEPAGTAAPAAVPRAALSFVIQKHAARNLHYDFRLELEGTLRSWAVPKGPSLDPAVKRMAVQVEDHPLDYAAFEGTIPEGHYGAGTVIVWDRGSWQPVGDAAAGLRAGRLKFDLHGDKLAGRWALVRMKPRPGERQPAWLLMKEKDAEARPAQEYDVVEALPDSVLSPPDGAASRRAGPAAPAGSATPPQSASGKSAAAAQRKAKAPAWATGGAAADDPVAATVSGPGASTEHGNDAGVIPATLLPQLATLVDAAPTDDGWLYEAKFDGYRLLARLEAGAARCITRNGNDWTLKMPQLAAALAALPAASAWIDGEIVVAGAHGAGDFQALQNAFERAAADAAAGRSTGAIQYYAFDLPYLDGADLTQLPLVERRARLEALLAAHPHPLLRFSVALDDDPAQLLDAARLGGLEGLIGKRRDSVYAAGRRSPDWIKLKVRQRQEFVVGGWTDPQGSRTGLGALLLGVYDDGGALRYAGNVGTGFSEETLADLQRRVAGLAAPRSPFVDAPASVGTVRKRKPHWLRPELVAEVSFIQWTQTARLRHAVFHGLRADKAPREVRREHAVASSTAADAGHAVAAQAVPAASPSAVEQAMPPSESRPKRGAAKPAAGRDAVPAISHPERVVDAQSGVTKGQLAVYYAKAAKLMLPHLKGRALSLLRAPAGVGEKTFFQRHAEGCALPGAELLDPALDPGHAPLLAIGSAGALLGAVQMNVIEFHTWNSTTRDFAHPDRMVFDLDPGEGVDFAQVREGAVLLRGFLDELGLAAWLKTSGGKGLHVVVPHLPGPGWEAAKDFSRAIVEHVARVLPQRFVARSGAANRVGRVYIDYLRNGFGATTACAWSARARPGLGVSVPLDWSELDTLTGGAHWSIAGIGARLAVGNAPWQGYAKKRQTLARAMKKLGFDAPAPS